MELAPGEPVIARMSDTPFHPLWHELRLIWHNRLKALRAERMQSVLHGAATVAGVGLLLAVLAAQQDMLHSLLVVLLAWPKSSLGALWLACLGDQVRHLSTRRQRWRCHWLAAAPVAEAQRRGYQRVQLVLRAAVHALLLALSLTWLAAPLPALFAALVTAALAALVAAALEPRLQRGPLLAGLRTRRHRGSVLAPRGTGSAWAWQRQAAAGAITPAAVAPLFLVWLLLPRGTAQMIAVAALMLLAAVTHSAWRRMLAQFGLAERWLAAEGVAPRRWLPPLMAPPLALLVAVSTTVGCAFAWAGAPLAAWALLAGGAMIAVLQLLVQAAERRRPRRAALALLLHIAVLATCLQAVPPLLPVLWAIQCGVLLSRSLR
ncbi:hypothetical protein [Pseudomarimonas salicorniae]|uniref:ABC-2 type transport system permease protein n=1 Tax=Pseudomarimonas salicorniae TaxID=2933270 RepID=A0ABT0GKH0_9GAMM|nr:hypothetical protein [Lysobacter sp. CAU 1642]MCK7595042.1 hypothetical protein [Lysobacter sp. CAU 1642]